MTYFRKIISSPLGKLQLIASAKGLRAILWEKENPKRVLLPAYQDTTNHPLFLEIEQQLADYFTGKLQAFSLALDLNGTDFQKRVWQALRTIPFAETRSYQQLATQIGHPRAARAVGAANGKNPIAIVVPCHRVIGAQGQLTGFAGGLATKAFLLDLETP